MTQKTKQTKATVTGSVSRRTFVAGAAAGTAVAAGVTGFPAVLRAQASTIKMGIVHPVTGFLQFSSEPCPHQARFGSS